MSNKGGRVSPDYLADIAPEYALMDHFKDTPERREGNDAKNYRPDQMIDHYWRDAKEYSCDCEDYPAFDT